MNRWFLLLVIVLAVCAFPGPLRSQERGGPSAAGAGRFDPARDADADIRAAVAEASKTGKRVLLDVGGEWCIWCRRLDTLFTTHSDLRSFRDAHYVVVKVNWSPENKNERVLSRYPKVAGYPHLFVLDAEGKLVHSQNTGDLEKGKGHDPVKVMEFLKQWARSE
ncbi:MAG TPA: thioredoxin family protein [Bacteroidota bacterium]|nr:thioredoxin family protein [Bacteroidota bacterium]